MTPRFTPPGSRAGRGDFRPVYSPSGFDGALRGAVEELRAGRWLAMRTLLADTGGWGLRTARTQVLGVVAAGSRVVQAWLAEEPGSADARVMLARVAVERAARAHREGHAEAALLERDARHACLIAAEALPADPVPWVGLLTLARLDVHRERAEHRERALEPMLPPGPWGLLYRVYERDRYNREAHHRMLHFLQTGSLQSSSLHTSMLQPSGVQAGGPHARPRGSGGTGETRAAAVDYVRWVTSWAPAASPLLALPLYAYVEQYRHRSETGQGGPWPRRQWAHEPVLVDTRNAFHGWYERVDPAGESVADLNHLAHALWAAGRFVDAARVFTDLGPYFTPQPWRHVAEQPGGEDAARTAFLIARAQSLAATGS